VLVNQRPNMWSNEETKYLQAVLQWQGAPPEEEKRMRRDIGNGDRMTETKPAGEFRVLVVGAKGVGKTSILTRVSFYSSWVLAS
jgi:GTPase SAR1 family protein